MNTNYRLICPFLFLGARHINSTVYFKYFCPDLPFYSTTRNEKKADKFNAAPYSTGKVAASFTSTASARETKHEAAILEDDIVRYAR